MVHFLNIFGLSLGLIGTIIIFLFGVPNVIDTGGKIGLCLEQEDVIEKKKIRFYKIISSLGLILLITSFLLQLIGEIISICC